ncbi:MAG: M1 family metallopeptidase [Myxococcales bacterium]|nr:M1 family metallopeptidase [Myxococcales bacterium]
MLALLVAIEVAGWGAGAVRTPSSPSAWGGVRERPEKVASYDIDATLDPQAHTVEGRERLTWHNRSNEIVAALYIHLYLNAFEGPGSTFNIERERFGGFRFNLKPKKGEFGSIELRKVTQSGKPVPWTYVHPDGGPDTDRTVARLDLPQPVAPGGTAAIDFEFHDQLPRVVARTGWFGSYHLVAQWFPKVGVLELPGERGATVPRWNCHEFHVYSEFYADFGSYHVKVTAPPGFTVGGTSAQDDIHDYAFVAWDGFAPPLERDGVKVLYPPEFEGSAWIALQATIDARDWFSKTLGPYPYGQITVVVPPFNAIESGAMEYETFFTTIGSNLPPLREEVRFVTVHEFGHGYFMGLLASNEFEEPFLDEGLNDFWDARMLAGERLKLPLLPPFSIFDYMASKARRFEPDPIAGNSWDRLNRDSYGLVYDRTAVVFHDLEARLGGDVLAGGFREYYRRWRFRHPSTADLEATLAEVAGPQADLVHRWFAEQVYSSTPVDDRVEKVENEEKRSVVEIRRYGARVPQSVRIDFENGPSRTFEWPADERWHRYLFDEKVAAARIDPKREVLLDLNKLDDGRSRERHPAASRRWTLEFKAWAELAYAFLESL